MEKWAKAIEEIAVSRGHTIVLQVIHRQPGRQYHPDKIAEADTAIEFTGPDSACDNIIRCMRRRRSGGLRFNRLARRPGHGPAILSERKGALSICQQFQCRRQYLLRSQPPACSIDGPPSRLRVRITEIHHTEKKDAPSGTAITLAEQILEKIPRKKGWVNHISDNLDELEILSERTDPAPGTHNVEYQFADRYYRDHAYGA